MLSIFFLNLIGHHIIFQLQQWQIKTEIKKIAAQYPNNKDEVVLVFSLNDKSDLQKIKWDGDDEFSLYGKMYDVTEKKIENGKLIIHCITDKQETRLIEKYDSINKNDFDNHSSNTKSVLLLKIFNSLYLPVSDGSSFSTNISSGNHFLFLDNLIPSGYTKILKPPPKEIS